MRIRIRAFQRWLYSHPAPRTAGNLIANIGVGILVAWFILDISSSGELVWKEALDTWATLFFIIYAVFMYVYYRGSYRFDRDLQRWNEPKFKEARLTEELFPHLMSAYKKRIQKGESFNLEQLKKDILG